MQENKGLINLRNMITMYSDINELRAAYYKFLSENARYSELERSYNDINNHFLALERRVSSEIKLLDKKIKALEEYGKMGIKEQKAYCEAFGLDFLQMFNKKDNLKVERLLKKGKMDELTADHQLKLKPIVKKRNQLENKLRPEFFQKLNHFTDQQLAIISESIETVEKPMRIHGIKGAGAAADAWWSFANDFKRWSINKDAFNQSKSITIRQALIGIGLLVITIIVISRLV